MAWYSSAYRYGVVVAGEGEKQKPVKLESVSQSLGCVQEMGVRRWGMLDVNTEYVYHFEVLLEESYGMLAVNGSEMADRRTLYDAD